MATKNQVRTIPFVHRLPELLALEGNYDGIVLSCRHRDILRCSVTRHFKSCFSPNGLYSLQPILYCSRPEICIIFKRDRSGAFEGRVFGFYVKKTNTIKLARFYGNELNIRIIQEKLFSVNFTETFEDVYFPLSG